MIKYICYFILFSIALIGARIYYLIKYAFTYKETFLMNEVEREFYLNVPKDYENSIEKFPAIIFIHAYQASAISTALGTSFYQDGPKKGYVTAFAQHQSGLANRGFNAGTCCGEAAKNKVDDVSYFRKMTDILIQKYKVDENRIFVTGCSNGGFMTYRLVCEMSDKIAGAAPFAAAFGWKDPSKADCKGSESVVAGKKGNNWDIKKCNYDAWLNKLPEHFSCKQVKEVPLLIINGKEDQIVKYEGFGNHPPVHFGPIYFREKYNCNSIFSKEIYYKQDSQTDFTSCSVQQEQTFENQNLEKCKTPVVQCIANKSGHWWWSSFIPYWTVDLLQSRIKMGPNTNTFNLNEQIIKFFDENGGKESSTTNILKENKEKSKEEL